MSEYNRNKHRDFVGKLRKDYPVIQEPKSKKRDSIKIRKPSRRKKTHLRGKMALLGLVGAITLGATGIHNYTNRPQNQPITLEEALENGKTLKDLNVSEEIRYELMNIQQYLENEEISNTELINMASQIEELQKNVITNKTADLLGVEPGDIIVDTIVGDKSEAPVERIQVKINEKGETPIYIRGDFMDLVRENTISAEISDFIKQMDKMKELEKQLEDKNLKREDVIEEYRETIDIVSKFAAGEMKIDENGNITIEQIKQKDIKEKPSEKEVEDEEYLL